MPMEKAGPGPLCKEIRKGTSRRDETRVEGFRGLSILNGGGAMITFLRTVRNAALDLTPWALYAMMPFGGLSAAFAVAGHFVRPLTSLWSKHGKLLQKIRMFGAGTTSSEGTTDRRGAQASALSPRSRIR